LFGAFFAFDDGFDGTLMPAALIFVPDATPDLVPACSIYRFLIRWIESQGARTVPVFLFSGSLGLHASVERNTIFSKAVLAIS
jgi:hypothetical protein